MSNKYRYDHSSKTISNGVKQFPTTGFSETDDDKEFGEGEFDLRYQYWVLSYNWCDCTKEKYDSWFEHNRRIIAVRISKPQEKEDGGKLILLKRGHPVVYEIHRNEISQTKNLLLTTTDEKFAARIVNAFNAYQSITPPHTSAGGEEDFLDTGELFQVGEDVYLCSGIIHDDEKIYGVPVSSQSDKESCFKFSEVVDRWYKTKRIVSASLPPQSATEPQDEKGLRWVKASERKPNDGCHVFLRFMETGGNMNIGYYDCDEKTWYWREYGDMKPQPPFPVDKDFEWLSESPSKEAGWIRVEDGLPEGIRKEGNKKFTNWVLGTNGKNQFVCVYTKGHELEYGDEDPSDEEYDEIESNNGCLYLKPGWYELEETPRGEYDETWVTRTVTHWRKLPSPPNSNTL